MNDGFFIEEEVSSLPFDEVDEIKTLNFIQQAIKKTTKALKKGVLYNGILLVLKKNQLMVLNIEV